MTKSVSTKKTTTGMPSFGMTAHTRSVPTALTGVLVQSKTRRAGFGTASFCQKRKTVFLLYTTNELDGKTRLLLCQVICTVPFRMRLHHRVVGNSVYLKGIFGSVFTLIDLTNNTAFASF